MTYFGQRQAGRLRRAGFELDRGTCARCGHDWWDHSFDLVHECQAWGCKCEKFVRNDNQERGE